MSREHAIELDGTVVEVLPRAVLRVALANGHRLVAWPGRGARSWAGQLAPGERVVVEVSPFDFSSGRLLRRLEQ